MTWELAMLFVIAVILVIGFTALDKRLDEVVRVLMRERR
jgi:hypothetical protein